MYVDIKAFLWCMHVHYHMHLHVIDSAGDGAGQGTCATYSKS